MADAAIARLDAARTPAELQAALLNGIALDDPLAPPNAPLQAAIAGAQTRLARQRMLAAAPTGVPLERQTSHDERSRLLDRLRKRRARGLDASGTEAQMRWICRDTRCTDCAASREYKAVCIQFTLECLAVRVKERLKRNTSNAYALDPAVTAFMTRFSANPLRVWISEAEALYALPGELDRMHASVVVPTQDGTEAKRKEAYEYRLHAGSIRRVIESLRRCEAA